MKNTILTIFAFFLTLGSFAAVGPITGASSVCVGATISLTDSTSGGVWSSSNTNLATVDSLGDVTGVAAGTATVTFSIGFSFAIKTVTVYPLPPKITGRFDFCDSGSTTLYDSAASGGYWSLAEGGTFYIDASTTNSVTIRGFGSSSGIVYFTDTNGCTTQEFLGVVPFLSPLRGKTTIYVDSSTLFGTSYGLGWYMWSSSDTSVATINDAGVATGISAGTTTITFTNGCILTATLTVLLPSGISIYSTTPESKISVFPSPVTALLTITSNDKIQSITISNLIGQTVFSNSYHDIEVQIDVSGLPAGMYLIRINGTELRKFVKE